MCLETPYIVQPHYAHCTALSVCFSREICFETNLHAEIDMKCKRITTAILELFKLTKVDQTVFFHLDLNGIERKRKQNCTHLQQNNTVCTANTGQLNNLKLNLKLVANVI